MNISFTGELHNIKLIQFSVNKNEVLPMIPEGITPFTKEGKCYVSLVDVTLKKMKPSVGAPFPEFGYRHVAFRLLIDDSKINGFNEPRGIYFIKSFTSRILIASGGVMFKHFNLGYANFKEGENSLEVIQDKDFIKYGLEDGQIGDTPKFLNEISRLDRAYFKKGEKLYCLRIQREKWPLKPVQLKHFSTNFFSNAEPVCALAVPEVIEYVWGRPEEVLVHKSVLYNK